MSFFCRWGWVLGLGLAGCQQLPDVAANGCGNRLVNAATEDCDGPSASGTCGEPGAVGECRFVCDRASSNARGGCPDGFACGLDTLCRRPTGGLLEVTSTAVAAERLLAGDLDGDGRSDLVALAGRAADVSASARIVYQDEGASVPTVLALAGRLSSPVFLPLTGSSARGALVSVSDAGLDVEISRSDRTTRPGNYPFFPLEPIVQQVRAVAFDALPSIEGGFGDELMVALRRQPPGQPAADVLTYLDGTTLVDIAPLPAPPDDFPGDLPHGWLPWPRSTEHPCPSLLLAPAQGSTISLLAPCVREDNGLVRWRTPQDEGITTLSLPSARLDGPVFVVDVNRDGFPDVLALVDREVTPGNRRPDVHVAYGTGLGYLAATPGGDATTQTAPLRLPPPLPGQPLGNDPPFFLGVGPILAFGHFDGDDLIDYVTRSDVYVSSDPLGYPQPSDFGDPPPEGTWRPHLYGSLALFQDWSEVKVCDLNGDGRSDLVAARDAASLDVLLGTGAGTFSRHTLTLEGSAGDLQVGDVDGDVLDDVIFRQRSAVGAATSDSLVVLFGTRQGIPSDLVTMAQFDEVVSLVPGQRPVDLDSTEPRPSVDLFSRQDGQFTAWKFQGSSDRYLRSSYTLQTFEPGPGKPTLRLDLPLAAAAARFSPGAPPGLAVVAGRGVSTSTTGSEGPPLQLWRLDLQDEGAIAAARPLGLDAMAPETLFSSANVVAHDLDGDGVDEIMVLLSDGGFLETTDADTTPERALVYQVDPTAGDQAPPFRQVNDESFRFSLQTSYPPVLADLDGDGRVELVAYNPYGYREDDQTTDSDLGTLGLLWVVPLRSTFSFDWAQAKKLKLPRSGGLNGFSVLAATAGQPARLLVAAERGLFVVALEGGELVVREQLTTTRAADVASGDFDGDGLPDVAVTSGSSLRLFRSASRLP